MSKNLNPRERALSPQVKSKSILLVWLVFICIILLTIWAYFSKIDVVVRGYGQIVPSQSIQQIQNLEGGIIQEVLVKEGEEVEPGQLLARIENTIAGSQYREALERSFDYKATIARLDALIRTEKNQDENTIISVNYPDEVLANPALVERHSNILEAVKQQSDAEYAVLQLQYDALENLILEEKAQKASAEIRLASVKKQRDLAAVALSRKAFSELEFLSIEQSVLELEGTLNELEYSIPRLEIERAEKQESINQYKAELILRYTKELGTVQAELISVNELLKAGGDRVQRTELSSPLRGLVKRIYYKTIGGVVPPGGTVMDVVPLDDSLIIEARFNPADIGFLSVGLDTTVRFSAYDYTTYGSAKGKVEHISADTLENSQGQIFYIVKIRTNETFLPFEGRKLPIIAGMQAEVDIITGKKSILDYILKPLMRVSNRAFREQ